MVLGDCGLTSFAPPGRTAPKVCPIPNSAYAAFRLRGANGFSFHEGSEIPPERLLQAVWQHQRLLREQLVTTEGERVRILHPGFLNREGGPDFCGAVIQFGDAKPVSGDVEVDLHAHGWKAHHHDQNPAFRDVILHVIWNGARTPGSPPTMTLAPRLDAPLNELGFWISTGSMEILPPACRGRCCAPLQGLPAEERAELLREAGEIRFRSKASQFQARARQVGWEQSLWEGIFRALGFKRNGWAMQCLAELRERWMVQNSSVTALQARLLGIGGLLPSDLTRARSSADDYLQTAWHQWWREREGFSDCLLPRTVWCFRGQRPANHPQRRLALAAHWILRGNLPEQLRRWGLREFPERQCVQSLFEILHVAEDPFWNWHWTLRSPRLEKVQPLLGAGRVTDLAVNVILPWLWIRAVEGKNEPLRSQIEQRFQSWPAAEDNAVLRLGRQRLLGVVSGNALRTAVEQQGLIQITRDFCDQSNAACEECRFPEFVRTHGGKG